MLVSWLVLWAKIIPVQEVLSVILSFFFSLGSSITYSADCSYMAFVFLCWGWIMQIQFLIVGVKKKELNSWFCLFSEMKNILNLKKKFYFNSQWEECSYPKEDSEHVINNKPNDFFLHSLYSLDVNLNKLK